MGKSKTRSRFETKDFKKLQLEWYKKLRKQGFRDAEFNGALAPDGYDTPVLSSAETVNLGNDVHSVALRQAIENSIGMLHAYADAEREVFWDEFDRGNMSFVDMLTWCCVTFDGLGRERIASLYGDGILLQTHIKHSRSKLKRLTKEYLLR